MFQNIDFLNLTLTFHMTCQTDYSVRLLSTYVTVLVLPHIGKCIKSFRHDRKQIRIGIRDQNISLKS